LSLKNKTDIVVGVCGVGVGGCVLAFVCVCVCVCVCVLKNIHPLVFTVIVSNNLSKNLQRSLAEGSHHRVWR